MYLVYIVVAKANGSFLHEVRQGLPTQDEMRELGTLLGLKDFPAIGRSELLEAFTERSFDNNYYRPVSIPSREKLKWKDRPELDAERAWWPGR